MQFLGFVVVICLAQIVLCRREYGRNCDGYEVKLINIENGDPQQTVTVEPTPEIRLNDKCEIIIKGCVTIKKSIKSASIKYDARRGKVDLSEREGVDLCKILNDSKSRQRCPYTVRGGSDRVCDGSLTFDLSKYQRYLPLLLGNLRVDAEVTVNKNDKNNFTLFLEVIKTNQTE